MIKNPQKSHLMNKQVSILEPLLIDSIVPVAWENSKKNTGNRKRRTARCITCSAAIQSCRGGGGGTHPTLMGGGGYPIQSCQGVPPSSPDRRVPNPALTGISPSSPKQGVPLSSPSARWGYTHQPDGGTSCQSDGGTPHQLDGGTLPISQMEIPSPISQMGLLFPIWKDGGTTPPPRNLAEVPPGEPTDFPKYI